MAKITDTGIEPVTQREYFDRLIALYLSIDPSWILDSNSPDGQFITAVSRMLSELDQEQVLTYNSRDPRTARKSQVDDLASLQGVYRERKRQSLVDLDIVGSAGGIIERGSQIKNKLTGSIWSLTENTPIGSAGEFQSLDYGLITATGEFDIVTPIDGWNAVANPTNFRIGREDESDVELETRRSIEATRKSVSMRDSVKAEVLAVPGVVSCEIIENEKQTEVNGQPGNSLHAIVMGGDELEIATAIDNKISIGCRTVGAIEHQVTSKEDPYGMPRRFDRATFVDIWVRYTIVGGLKIPVEAKDAVGVYVERYAKGQLQLPFNANHDGFTLGQSPSANLMSTPLNMVLGGYLADDSTIYTKSVEISKDGSNWVTGSISISRLESALFDSSRVLFVDA